jgi:hypothetical protein
MTFARAWTGFDRQATRGNVEAVWGYSTSNWIDPMTLNEDWRDVFPKMDLRDDFIGDRYPLCVERPSRAFLRKGATWRYLGQVSPHTHDALFSPVRRCERYRRIGRLCAMRRRVGWLSSSDDTRVCVVCEDPRRPSQPSQR